MTGEAPTVEKILRYWINRLSCGREKMTILSGRPWGIILRGPYLSDQQFIAVGYALDQAINERIAPEIDTSIAQIDASPGE
ncbi:hypothetical protein [Caldilinea sp.]|uniref:hypothetical protein n=1 Tax=Caldilinea sp. TaxID=2293560 RepID=UPI002C7D2D83|nr:hypothetical protein [Anaerolineales bacterium]HQY90510.1 hypothetical protein [Caldilinea sp.]HRA68316.1 hypothetical protein [Caldilinea sp.]